MPRRKAASASRAAVLPKARTPIKPPLDLDALRLTAHADGWAGCDACEFDQDESGQYLSATFTAYKLLGPHRVAFRACLWFAEELAISGPAEKALAAVAPRRWLGERAEGEALRRAFRDRAADDARAGPAVADSTNAAGVIDDQQT